MKTGSLALLFVMSTAVFAHPQMGGQTPSNREYDRKTRQIDAMTSYPVPVLRAKVDLQKIKAEADELAKLAQTIPPDIDQCGRGAVPKDLSENLKKIEKLSKRLRRDLSL